MFSSRTLCLFMFLAYIIVGECKGDQIQGYDPAPQCKNADCPSYTVIHSEKEFEIRNYNEALWMSSSTIVQYSIMGGLGNGGENLTLYYNRNNDQGVNIEKTEPIVMMDVLINSSYTNFYYVPKKYQIGGLPLPEPLTPEIKQVKLPKFKYAAVRRSMGEFTDDVIALQIDALKRNLQGTAYQRAAARDQFTLLLYSAYDFLPGYELLIWFD